MGNELFFNFFFNQIKRIVTVTFIIHFKRDSFFINVFFFLSFSILTSIHGQK